MIQRRECLRLTLEARDPVVIAREGVGEDFDGDLSTKVGISGSIDFAHPAHAERGRDLVRAESRPNHMNMCRPMSCLGAISVVTWLIGRLQSDKSTRDYTAKRT
jgi:hypothetical protein